VVFYLTQVEERIKAARHARDELGSTSRGASERVRLFVS